MRLALFSALADPPGTHGASVGERPAFRRFAGKTVLAHQLDCAAHLGCERVLCQVAAATGPDLAPIKAHAERLGLRFEAVDSTARLQALITAADIVLVIEDGVLPDQAMIIEHLGDRSTVLAFPEEPAVAVGFERLDATRAWSGVLLTRGDSVARLADLLPDCAVAPSLLRIALQSGAQVIEMDAAPLTQGTWQRRVDRKAAPAAERHWVARQVRLAGFAAPGRALVERIGLRLAQDAAGGRWRRCPHGVAASAGLLAGAAGLLDWPVVGLGLLLVVSAALAIARIFERVEALGAPRRGPNRLLAFAAILRDATLVALLTGPIMVVPSWLGFTLSLMLMGLLWLGETIGQMTLRWACSDRILLIAVLIPLVYLGWATLATTALLLIVLSALLWSIRAPHKQLTPD